MLYSDFDRFERDMWAAARERDARLWRNYYGPDYGDDYDYDYDDEPEDDMGDEQDEDEV